jgi:hypothetical protein
MKVAVRSQPLNRENLAAVGLHGKHRAGFHRVTIQYHGAGAANGGFASDVRSRQSRHVTQIVDKEQPRLDIVLARNSVYFDIYFHDGAPSSNFAMNAPNLADIRPIR